MSNYLQIFITLLSLLNPILALSQFLSLTRGMTKNDKQNVAIVCGLTVFGILGAFLFLGDYIMQGLSIHAYSLQLGGGLILLILGINIIMGKTDGDKEDVSTKVNLSRIKSLGVSPLALPMIVGPASMVMVVVYGQSAHSFFDKLSILMILAILSTIIAITFLLADYIAKAIGEIGIVIITKIMGLIVTAIGFEMIIAAMQTVVPMLMKH
jgi:MarC family membrane protein